MRRSSGRSGRGTPELVASPRAGSFWKSLIACKNPTGVAARPWTNTTGIFPRRRAGACTGPARFPARTPWRTHRGSPGTGAGPATPGTPVGSCGRSPAAGHVRRPRPNPRGTGRGRPDRAATAGRRAASPPPARPARSPRPGATWKNGSSVSVGWPRSTQRVPMTRNPQSAGPIVMPYPGNLHVVGLHDLQRTAPGQRTAPRRHDPDPVRPGDTCGPRQRAPPRQSGQAGHSRRCDRRRGRSTAVRVGQGQCRGGGRRAQGGSR